MIRNRRHHPNLLAQQQGVVIIVALFFVALVAAISWYMMGRLERDTHRTQLLLRNVNAELYAQGSLQWAITQLKANVENQKPDQIVDRFPMASPVDEVNGYRISSTVTDAQARFNLNNLRNPKAQEDFRRLVHLLVPALANQQLDEMLVATVDWVTPGQQLNKLNKYYMGLPQPYRAAHALMVNASEWRQVKGVTPALYAAMEKYLVALPATTQVNVLNAPGALLAALSPDMDLSAGLNVEKICRQKKPITTDAFLAIDVMKTHPIEKDKITILSNYFLVETKVEIEDQHIVLYTLVERKGSGGNNASVTIISQSKSVPG